jgi:hypothetical protein
MSLVLPFQTEGLEEAGRQIKDFSKQSRIALTSLSLVAQDLPFGFIGIQNNLPALIQTFGSLRAETGSVGGALKELGKGLVGPAGLFLAFSAVTSAVTFAIQKYGSLGEAFDALIGVLPKVTEQQKLFNSESAKAAGNVVVEEEKIKIFSKTLNDLSQPLKNRLAAYDALKKISPDLVASVDRENISNKASIDIINGQVESRLKLLQLKIQEAGVTAVLTKNAEQLAIKQQELAVADQDYVKASKALVDAQNNQVVFGPALTALQNNAQSAFSKTSEKTIELRKEILDLTKTQDGYLKQLAPIANSTAAINSETTTLTENYKKLTQSIKDANRASIGAITEGIGGEAKDLFSARVNEANIKRQVDSIKKLTKEQRISFREYIENKNAIQNALTLSDFNDPEKDFAKRDFKVKELKGISDQILNADLYKQFSALDELVTKFEETKNALTSIFFDPLSNLFENFFETGKLALKDFGDAVLKQIQRIVAKIIATGIIKLIASILFPGGAAASAAGTAASTIGSILSSGGGTGGIGGGIANPSFSGIGGSPLSMNGQVNLILRGSDLVGSLNRTNSTINRVG